MGSHDAVAGHDAPGAALVAAAADADPVTRLVLGWLAGKRSEHTRTAYARDLGIIPRRRTGQAPSWLAWCRTAGVHPVTGVTGLHVAVYARQLSAAELSPSSAARKLAAVAGWYAWLERRGHIPAGPPRADRGSGFKPRPRGRHGARCAARPYRGAGRGAAVHRGPGLRGHRR